MTQLSASDVPSQKAQTYASHLTGSLLPSLEAIRQQVAQLEHDIAEYQDLVAKLGEMGRTESGTQETMMDLGAGVFVDARIPETSKVTLDLGLNVHLDMPLEEAGEYSKKRIDVLQRKYKALKSKEDDVLWQIEQADLQFRGALNEVGP